MDASRLGTPHRWAYKWATAGRLPSSRWARSSGRHDRKPINPSAVAGKRCTNATLNLAVGAIATLLAVIESWHTSLWTDEAATISAAQRPLRDLWTMVHSIDVVHGSYYLFMHLWTGLFGQSPLALRLPSAILVGVAACLTAGLSRQLTDGRTAVTAGLVVAVLPRVTWAGMEARPYAATITLAAAATSVLVTAVRRPSIGRWMAYAVLLATGCYLNVYIALLGLGHLCSLLLDRESSTAARKAWVLSAAGAALLAAPILLAAVGQTGQLGSAVRNPLEWIRNIVVNQWFLGDTPTTTTGRSVTAVTVSDAGSWWAPASVVLSVVGWLTVLFGIVRAAHRSGTSLKWLVERPFSWAVPWLVAPTIVIVGYSLTGTPVYSPRYLAFATPALAILMATGVQAACHLRYRFGAIVLLVVATVPVYLSQRELYGKNGSDWVSVSAYMAEHSATGDCIYFTPRYPGATGPIGQTTRGIAVAYPQDFSGLADLTLLRTPAAAGNLAGESRSLADAAAQLADCVRVWVVQRNDYPEASVAKDIAIMTNARLRGRTVWAGPLDRIALFGR